MLFQATKKIEGGKLVRVKIKADEYIKDIQVSGDFFLHPEDSLLYVEQNLRNLHKDTPPEEIATRIKTALTRENGSFIGLTAEDLAQTIVEAFQSGQQPTS